ncbi:MAG: peptidyl-prolyl cis-trans isomerase [Myxococcaceae bacterium]|nr:peptidyl-prolyl cis-trans isomerase [Myxococcaceae bacterium]
MKHTAAWVGMLLCAAGCREQAHPQQDPNVIATVNGEVVSRAEFEAELSRDLQAMEGAPPRTPEQIEPYKQALLETLVERTVLLQAARAANVRVTPEEVDRRVLALTSEYPAESFDAALAQGQMSKTELERKTEQQLTVERLLQEQVYARVAVTEDAIRKYFNENADTFTEPERVRASQIVVAGLDDAKRIQGQLGAGKKFAELARRYSLSPDAKVGGDLGFFPRGVMPSQFDDVVFRLSVGQVSEIVTTEFGFHLFKVVEKKPARKRDLPEVRTEIEEKLLNQLRAEGQKEYVKSIRAKAEVKVNDQVLQTVTGRATSVRPTGQ